VRSGDRTRLLEDSDPTDARNRLLEQLETLADQLREEEGQPRNVPARPREARDEPAWHGIAGSNEDNGDGARRSLGGQGSEGSCVSHDDIHPERSQLGRKSGEPLVLSLGIAVFDHHAAALHVTEVTQSLTKGLVQGRAAGQAVRQVADSRGLGRRLGLGDKRARKETAGQRAEEGPARRQWITSSARASTDGGIASPSALAVFMLIVRSYRVGCSTGNSDALAPRRSLSTWLAARSR